VVSPSNASVTINGILVPVINGHFKVFDAPQMSVITVSANGYIPQTKVVTPTLFGTTNVDINLLPGQFQNSTPSIQNAKLIDYDSLTSSLDFYIDWIYGLPSNGQNYFDSQIGFETLYYGYH